MYQLANYVTFLTAGGDYSGMRLNLDFDFSGILGIAAYVLLALGLYAIAKRRGISKPWLAWVPFGQTWMLGCVSDQYQYVVMGQRKSKRKVMLTLEIVMTVLSVVMVVLCFIFVVQMFTQLDMELILQDPEAFASTFTEAQAMELVRELMGSLIGILVMALPLMVVAIWLLVMQFMAYHDIFASCDPKNKTLFTVLGIVLSFFGLSVLMSIFVFISRNKDEGMPPRVEEQPVVTDPAFAPVVEAPAAPIVEPAEEQAPAIFSDEGTQQ